jgi:hypothetical protein
LFQLKVGINATPIEPSAGVAKLATAGGVATVTTAVVVTLFTSSAAVNVIVYVPADTAAKLPKVAVTDPPVVVTGFAISTGKPAGLLTAVTVTSPSNSPATETSKLSVSALHKSALPGETEAENIF